MDDKVAVVVLSLNSWNVSDAFMRHYTSNTDIEKTHLIWIDNGSIDETVGHVKKYNDDGVIKTLVLEKENTGVIGGRNIGFDLFLNDKNIEECNYLMFLDNDQFVKRGWLEDHIEFLKSGYDLIGVEAWKMSPRFLPIQKLNKPNTSYSYVGCGGSLIKREVVDSVGKYDEQFNPCYFEDPDYCFRTYDAGFKIGWNPNAKIEHIGHQTLGNSPKKKENFINSLNKFRKKWGNKSLPILNN